MIVMDILLATDAQTVDGVLYDLDGDGVTEGYESLLRQLASEVYSAICEAGNI